MSTDTFDIAVIGAGFGGLATAVRGIELGARVLLIERLTYPGGCASTFTRGGQHFESGATLFSGFARGQIFQRWIETHALDVAVHIPNPMVRFRSPHVNLDLGGSQRALVESFMALYPDSREGIARFFAWQSTIADTLWSLFDEPALLPPFGAAALFKHFARAPRYLPLARIVGTSLLQQMERFSVAHLPALRQYADAVSQISVQASAAEAEAPFALATLDYFFRGTGHVQGGIGVLAQALAGVVSRGGGAVHFGERALRVTRRQEGFVIATSKGSYAAERVALNLTPAVAADMLGVPEHPALAALSRKVDAGWGAVMAYFTVPRDANLLPHAHHLQLIDDPARPFVEGNHVFCSVSDCEETERAQGARTVTMSTHVALTRLRDANDRAALVNAIQADMWRTLTLRAPELAAHASLPMPGSPRTFARFTGRQGGAVGGIPRRVGLSHYSALGLCEPMKNAWLIGDSVGLGQSTLATALSGVKLAEAMAKRGGR